VPSHCSRWALIGALALASPAFAASDAGDDDDAYLPKVWKEQETALPPPPAEKNLQAFYLNEVAQNRFFIDTESLSVGADGVVRYTLLVLTPGGARNVSYEGMRCETRQWRVYALGRADGTWTKARKGEWMPVRDESVNRYHAALFLDYFCVDGVIADDAEAIRKALRRAGRR